MNTTLQDRVHLLRLCGYSMPRQGVAGFNGFFFPLIFSTPYEVKPLYFGTPPRGT